MILRISYFPLLSTVRGVAEYPCFNTDLFKTPDLCQIWLSASFFARKSCEHCGRATVAGWPHVVYKADQICHQKGFEAKGSTVQIWLHHPWNQAEVFLCQGPFTFLKSGLIQSHSGYANLVSAEVPFFPVHVSCSNGKLHEWQCQTCILQLLQGRSHSSTACMFWK